MTLSILSYFSRTAWWPFLLGLAGLGMSAAWLHKNPPGAAKALKFSVPFPFWIWGLVGLAACFFRFYRLDSLLTWPLTDEGVHGWLALDLLKTGKFHFFYTVAQFPPFFIWGLAGFFKLFGPSLLTFWLFPALLSLLAPLFAYLAARKFLSPFLRLIFTLLTAVSFWPLLAGRFCHPGISMLFWEYVALWRMGCFWLAPEKARAREAFFLGLTLGLGFYTFTAWPAAALVFSGPALWKIFGGKKGNKAAGFCFLAPLVLVLIPLIVGAFREGLGLYLWQAVFSPEGGSEAGGKWLQTAGGYLLTPFVGSADVTFYGPVWGGFFNPVLGTLFLLGLLVILRNRTSWALWLVLSLPILWLPGVLAGGVEFFRILLVCPFVLAIASIGFSCFLSTFPLKKVFWGMGLTVLVSLVLDANHLFAVYPDPNSLPEDKKEWRSPELAQACQALQHQSLSGQPVWILSNLSLKPTCAFSVATYAFNAVENPDLHSTPSHTVAVLANSNYQPFLEKKFPEAAWQWLPSPAPDRDSGLLLGIISSSPPNSEALGRWVKAENFLLAERDRAAYRRIDYDWSSSVDRLKQAYGLFQGDPFLESIYWEKLGFYDASGNRLPEAVEDLRMALLKGYPSANLFYSLGVFLNFEGKTQEARQAFEMALHCPVNRTAAGARLEEMGLKEPPL